MGGGGLGERGDTQKVMGAALALEKPLNQALLGLQALGAAYPALSSGISWRRTSRVRV